MAKSEYITAPIEKNDIRVAELLEPGIVEKLIKEQRNPVIFKRDDGSKRLWPSFTVAIPPEGTQKGDGYSIGGELNALQVLGKLLGRPVSEEIVFLSPDGEERGKAELIKVTAEQARLLDARFTEAFKASKYNYIRF